MVVLRPLMAIDLDESVAGLVAYDCDVGELPDLG